MVLCKTGAVVLIRYGAVLHWCCGFNKVWCCVRLVCCMGIDLFFMCIISLHELLVGIIGPMLCLNLLINTFYVQFVLCPIYTMSNTYYVQCMQYPMHSMSTVFIGMVMCGGERMVTS